jgi:hypothetical protein
MREAVSRSSTLLGGGVRRERLLLGRSAAVVVVKEGRGRRGSERSRGIYNLRSLE